MIYMCVCVIYLQLYKICTNILFNGYTQTHIVQANKINFKMYNYILFKYYIYIYIIFHIRIFLDTNITNICPVSEIIKVVCG